MTAQTQDMLKRLGIAVVFGIAFAYIESAVVVYLRAIFHPHGFTFPLEMFGVTAEAKRLFVIEVGREAATLVLILTAAWLFGRLMQERAAYFLVIFAVWDVFYYVWLKVLLDWPGSIMDWDVLFLIPVVWASAALYPVLVSALMFAFGAAILYRCAHGRPLVVTRWDWLGWLASTCIVIAAFCLGGRRITHADYAEQFPLWLFAAGFALGVGVCIRATSRRNGRRELQTTAATA
ncbi:MAG TPA: hypothetical protein PKH24_02845 [Sedimentisphaerales bacterium]|nr:hypothetical protein [Sedimentisphaerales bacterium]HNU27995.1 hypothetical protein [Sedimentisphaerales bacterium]